MDVLATSIAWRAAGVPVLGADTTWDLEAAIKIQQKQ
jgi:hypothetical protein